MSHHGRCAEGSCTRARWETGPCDRCHLNLGHDRSLGGGSTRTSGRRPRPAPPSGRSSALALGRTPADVHEAVPHGDVARGRPAPRPARSRSSVATASSDRLSVAITSLRLTTPDEAPVLHHRGALPPVRGQDGAPTSWTSSLGCTVNAGPDITSDTWPRRGLELGAPGCACARGSRVTRARITSASPTIADDGAVLDHRQGGQRGGCRAGPAPRRSCCPGAPVRTVRA